MTPGTYLRLRREAAGLSIDDVAAQLATEPRWSEIDRKQWLGAIEGDVAPLAPVDAAPLLALFRFDEDVLFNLQDIRADRMPFALEICERCGCSDYDPCATPDRLNCGWANDTRNLCTACADRILAADDQGAAQ